MRRRSRGHGRALALSLALLACLGCHRDEGTSADPEARALVPAPLPVDHGPAPAYAGTWVGPALTLTFVGPWVIVRPTGAGPEQAPIELRVEVERAQGDAYALRTSLGARLPADFLRPPDWTMLVEEGQLAIAMGDEPLTAYLPEPEASAPLLGPAMLEAFEPGAPPADAASAAQASEEAPLADALACLELAGAVCAELEDAGPLAAGCRELHWVACMDALGPSPVDPVARAARAASQKLAFASVGLRFADSLRHAAPAPRRALATALYARALERAQGVLDELAEDGPLPELPELPGLLAALALARDEGLLAAQ